ncbi:TlpA disulfide reductase family protein [Streptomyces mobaraensis]|uniref:TlpA disulfide reductase family protein n=1 Tax=Streptomyces mobaraensis TaxID=35621 RepID=UPI00332D0B1A
MFGVIRRLREHTALLSRRPDEYLGPAVGAEIGEFSATTVDGVTVSRAHLKGETLVAFFAHDCSPCHRELPNFVEYAGTHPGGRERVLAVVAGNAEEAADFLTALGPVAEVVLSERDGQLTRAFGVEAFPTLLKVVPGDAGRPVVGENAVDLSRPALTA